MKTYPLPDLNEPRKYKQKCGKIVDAAFPYEFYPTFHRYHFDMPQKIKKPQTIFVGSMADMFGEWVPDEWIEEVFKACEAAPQHRYLFLTKNPRRYMELINKGLLPIRSDNFWWGATANTPDDNYFYSFDPLWLNTFVSIEPMQEAFSSEMGKSVCWIIVGAETGNRKDKIIPKREWIKNIVNACRAVNVPVFLKNNLTDIWQEPLIQEFPWEGKS